MTQMTSVSDAEPVVVVENLAKSFKRADGTTVHAIDDVTFSVAPGECVVLLGPSGCGKTTLLRSLAGLTRPDSGSISIMGQPVFGESGALNVPPQRRRASMLFQSYALWPHMTALNNVGYPLKCRRPRISAKERVERSMEALEMVGVPELAGQHPGQMSGGQQQRVALARALVGGERLILFDEPLSNVDAKVRERLREELITMQETIGYAAIYVTHDQDEAMELADRVAVLQRGKLVQLAPPREIYSHPVNRYVADFVGRSNELPGVVRDADPRRVLVGTDIGNFEIDATAGTWSGGDAVRVMWRPETGTISTTRPAAADQAWEGSVVKVEFSGGSQTIHISIGGVVIRHITFERLVVEPGEVVWLSPPTGGLMCFPSDR